MPPREPNQSPRKGCCPLCSIPWRSQTLQGGISVWTALGALLQRLQGHGDMGTVVGWPLEEAGRPSCAGKVPAPSLTSEP